MSKSKQDKQIIIERYDTDISQGLSDVQILSRKQQKLVNNTKQKTSKSYLKIIFDNVFTFFNLLWIAIFVALVIVKSYSNLPFMVVIVLNTAIAIFQEIRSKKTVEKLAMVTAPKVKVVRNGEEIEILSNEIVLDDILVLSIGNQIPADCILLEGVVEVNESLLTGESKPVKKEKDAELLAGSFLTSGKCYARANKIGKDSYIQTLAKEAKKFKQPNSNLFRDLKKIIKYIGIFILPIGALMFCNSYLWTDGGTISTAVAETCGSLVGMIPAGMFLLISVALTVGVIKLAEKKTLVQDLYSIEMLARSNVLCLDKTGTITDGTMTVKEIKLYGDTTEDEVLKAVSNIMASQPTQNATSLALIKRFGAEISFKLNSNICFSSDRKYTATCFEKEGTYVVGASQYIKAKINKEIEKEIEKYASEGYRVLLLAHSKKKIIGENLPNDLEGIAIILIEDTIRPDAIETIKWFKENNVEIKIISGDDPQTVSFIASRVGVNKAEQYINLEGMPLEEVKKIANKYTVFGRVSPEQKHAIIQSLKEKNVVAMTGDGVNDTLALKEADCSIAMADGSEVARNISHLVLLNSNFSSLPTVVEEGRRVINNVQKSSTLFLMKTVLTILLSVFVLCLQIKYPFQPKQMFLLEFFVIGLPSFFLALQPNKDLVRGDFIPYVLKRGIPYGLIMFVNIVLILLMGKFNILTQPEYKSLATIVLTVTGFLNLVLLCLPYTLNKFLITLGSALGLVIFGFLIPDFFGIVAVTTNVWKLALVLFLITAVFHVCVKNAFFIKRFRRKNESKLD